jgi:hypothetical protein
LQRKGDKMKAEELLALRNELQDLNVEINRFKEELLATRVEELERIIRASARRPNPRVSAVMTRPYHRLWA